MPNNLQYLQWVIRVYEYVTVSLPMIPPLAQKRCIFAVARGSHLVWQCPSPVTNRVAAVADTSSFRQRQFPSMSVAVATFITLTCFSWSWEREGGGEFNVWFLSDIVQSRLKAMRVRYCSVQT